jgi:hypothetical protein
VVGDIKEMFHQVLAREEDRPAMKFFWSKNSDTVHEYEMCVMSFGATCSPTIAQYVKNKNASDHAGVYPAAALSVKRNTYVDDWLVSGWNKDKLAELTQEVQAINRAAGFEMGKWICNHKEIVSWLGISNSELGLDNTGENKVLGMKWLVNEDEFIYKVNPRIFGEFKTTSGRPTKRELLSFVMSIFDPLGLIAFVTIGPKLLLRETWKQELDWDDQIPEHMMGARQQWI